MFPYIVRRVFVMILMLTILSIITFLLFNAVPTDPARLTCGKVCTPEIVAANRIRLGLDQPLYVQYIDWIKGIFVGRTFGSGSATFDCSTPCLGYSFRNGEEVTTMIVDALPVTMYLALGAFTLWMLVGISAGIIAAKNHGKWQDRTIMGISLIGYSLPVFFVGLLLLVFVIVRWNLLPYPDYESPFDDPVAFFQTMLLPWVS